MRRMRPLAWTFAGLLLAAPLGSALATDTSAATAPANQPASKKDAQKAAQTRAQAIIAFQRDLVSVIAPRADADPLLGAALLARPLTNQPKYNDFHTLIERATAAGNTLPAISWVRLSDCDDKAGDCPNADALAKLKEQAPDNAAVWLLALGVDEHNAKDKDARADLARAAAAKLYDDYTGESLKAIADVVSTLPPPASVVDPNMSAGANGVQMLMTYSITSTQPRPGLQATAKMCEAGKDASLRDDCLKLGHILEWGSSPLARSLGLHLREVLSSDPLQSADAKHQRRNLVWQVQNFAQLCARAQNDKALAQHLLALARNAGTEMRIVPAALRDYSIPLEAPTDAAPAPAATAAGA